MPTRHTLRLLLIVSAADQAAANTICEGMGFGPSCFSVPLVRTTDADGAAPRAFIASWAMIPAQAQALRSAFVAAGIEARGHRVALDHYDPQEGRPTVAEALGARNLKRRREVATP